MFVVTWTGGAIATDVGLLSAHNSVFEDNAADVHGGGACAMCLLSIVEHNYNLLA